ncbi:hypothetical protein OnM2_070069 [Erysiphe neolycopersici]|uniref:Wax synthase domain-containing protein n=1 Tax=Erysiphe neolycopersici TaxID=212602 RepID=A0A420HKK2_9PEZI|nr:hypothetical protein OnM2_070069 [Erysiphe neolycopersici]
MASLCFPNSPNTGPAPTANEIYSTCREVFKQQVSEGLRRPIIFPYNFLSLFTLVAYLCIPHKQNPIIYAVRWPLVGLITWFELRLIQESSGVGIDLGYRTGATSAIILMLSWTWLIFKKPQWNAKRVERRRVQVPVKESQLTKKKPRTFDQEPCTEKFDNNAVPLSEEGHTEVLVGNIKVNDYFWQSYPEDLKERLSWVMDLLFNARGSGWNWSVPTIPKLTPEIQSKLGGMALDELHPSYSWTAEKKQFCVRYQNLLPRVSFHISYFLIFDIVRSIMMKDPYFKLGPTTYDLPSYIQSLHPSVLQFYRLLLSAVGVLTYLTLTFANIDILMSCVLGTTVLGLRGEPWYYPPTMGNISYILDKGLNGLWGGFWHQIFRNFFTAPTKYLITEGYIKAGYYSTKILGLIFAFAMSGFLHWASAKTSFIPTHPIQEAIFFIAQGFGVVLQESLCCLFSSLIVRLPKTLRQTGNLSYTLGWLYLTGWLAADDFARAGFWLVEPFLFSPTQALGLGEHDGSWNCWKPLDFVWYSGKYWWESGITIL